MTARIAVIGAGISGLAAATWLRKLDPDVRVTIFERDERVGGKIRTDHVDGFVIDGGPDAFLSSKPGGLSLSRELGLEHELIGPNPANKRSFVLSRGRLVPLPEGLSGLVPGELRPMFRSPLLSPRGKARLLLDLVLPPKSGDDDESLQSFISRRLGGEMYERMIEPLLAGIYAGDGAKLSLAATFPQLRTAEQTHGGIIKGAVAQKREAQRRKPQQLPARGFLGFADGMSRLVNAAAAQARANGTDIRLGAAVEGIQAAGDGGFDLSVVEPGRRLDERFDGVIVATPAWAAAPLLEQVAPEASRGLESIDHVSSALVVVAFPESQLTRPLDGYGYVVPRVEQRDVMAMTWISSKWEQRAPEGQVLVRGFVGRAGREAALAGGDASLVELMIAELKDVLHLDVAPTLARVYRWDGGMPQYNLGHLDRVATIEQSLARVPAIQLAGNMLRGVGIPDCVVSGQAAATNLLADLRALTAETPPRVAAAGA
jgi:oxygen-dependent protoporphyrinogen oxidase